MLENNIPTPSLRRYLIRGAFGSLAIKLSQAGFSFLLVVLLARFMGVKGFGIYAFCISIVNLLTVPAMLGGQQLLVREVAAYKAMRDFHFLRGLLQRVRQASTAASIILSLSAAGFGLLVFRENQIRIVFLVAVCLVPLLTAMNLQNAVLRGLHHILLGQASLTLVPVLIISIIGFLFLTPGFKLTPEAAVIIHVASVGFLVIVFYFLLGGYLPREVSKAEPEYETSRWIKSMLPFLFAGGMQILNREVPVILLGIMQGAESVGLFRVAQRGAELVPFGLLAVNMAIAPTVAELYAKGEKDRLQHIISKGILVIMVFAMPVAMGLILGGMWLIPLIFGPAFTPAYIPMVILCTGQLVNVAMGPVGLILNMAGFERIAARGVTIAAFSSIVLNLVLIPFFGPIGAALATSTSLIIWNVLLAIWLYRKTGILSIFRLKQRPCRV